MSTPTNPQMTVAVIGAGIVGVSAALWLLRDGHRVILIEARGPAEGTSHGNAGARPTSAPSGAKCSGVEPSN